MLFLFLFFNLFVVINCCEETTTVENDSGTISTTILQEESTTTFLASTTFAEKSGVLSEVTIAEPDGTDLFNGTSGLVIVTPYPIQRVDEELNELIDVVDAISLKENESITTTAETTTNQTEDFFDIDSTTETFIPDQSTVVQFLKDANENFKLSTEKNPIIDEITNEPIFTTREALINLTPKNLVIGETTNQAIFTTEALISTTPKLDEFTAINQSAERYYEANEKFETEGIQTVTDLSDNSFSGMLPTKEPNLELDTFNPQSTEEQHQKLSTFPISTTTEKSTTTLLIPIEKEQEDVLGVDKAEIITEINVVEVINGAKVIRKLPPIKSLSLIKENSSEINDQSNNIDDVVKLVQIYDDYLKKYGDEDAGESSASLENLSALLSGLSSESLENIASGSYLNELDENGKEKVKLQASFDLFNNLFGRGGTTLAVETTTAIEEDSTTFGSITSTTTDFTATVVTPVEEVNDTTTSEVLTTENTVNDQLIEKKTDFTAPTTVKPPTSTEPEQVSFFIEEISKELQKEETVNFVDSSLISTIMETTTMQEVPTIATTLPFKSNESVLNTIEDPVNGRQEIDNNRRKVEDFLYSNNGNFSAQIPTSNNSNGTIDTNSTETDALPSNQASKSLAAEIMGACIGCSAVIGVLVYYAIKRYKGKTRNFKPNSAVATEA